MTDNAEDFEKTLKRQGWCFVTVEALDGETLVVLRDKPPLRDFEKSEMEKQAKRIKDKSGITDTIPCYTLSEFMVLIDHPSPKLLHTAKKQGATIETKGE